MIEVGLASAMGSRLPVFSAAWRVDFLSVPVTSSKRSFAVRMDGRVRVIRSGIAKGAGATTEIHSRLGSLMESCPGKRLKV